MLILIQGTIHQLTLLHMVIHMLCLHILQGVELVWEECWQGVLLPRLLFMVFTIWLMDIIVMDMVVTSVMESSSMGNMANMEGLDLASLSMVGKGGSDEVSIVSNM